MFVLVVPTVGPLVVISVSLPLGVIGVTACDAFDC